MPDTKEKEEEQIFDELLLATPSVALGQCRSVVSKMADMTKNAVNASILALYSYDDKEAKTVIAVSYTHLDVYKRQERGRPVPGGVHRSYESHR